MTFRDPNRKAVFLIALALFVSMHAVRATDNNGVVQGVVKNSSGQAVSGAFVKFKNAERRLTFMVISQAQGRYTADTADKLPPGKYALQGVGNGFQSQWSAPVDVAAGKTAKLDLSLTAPQAPPLPNAWPHRIPEEEAGNSPLPEGEGKPLVATRCAACHTLDWVTRTRFDRKSWESMIEDMREVMKNRGVRGLTEDEAKVILNYLAANYPPMPTPDPNSRLPRTLMKGDAMKYRVVEYDLVATESSTHDIASDPWGHGWANMRYAPGRLGHFDPDTLQYSEAIPPTAKGQTPRLGNLQISSNGVVWLPEGTERRWLSYDIKAEKWTSYPFPSTIRGGSGGNSLAIGPDGMIYGSGPGSVRMLNPETKEWKSFDSPSAKQNPGGYGLTVAGDGSVWLAEEYANKMLRVDPATGKVEEFKIPLQEEAFPRRLGADAEGNLWVGLWRAGKLMKIDYKTKQMTMYDPPTPRNGAYTVSVDKTRNWVWVSLHRADKIARFNPKTQEWVEFPLPQAETDVRRIEVDKSNPNRIWWSSAGGTTAGTTGGEFDGGARMGFIEILN